MSLFQTQTVTAKRFGGGGYVAGRWVENATGAPNTWDLACTIQPAPAARLQALPEGTRLRDIMDLYTSEALYQADSDLGRQADEVFYGNRWFVVITGDFFESGLIPHGEYVVERKKEGTK